VSGTGGVFTVQGTHTYQEDSLDQDSDVYQITVDVSEGIQTVLSAMSSVVVVRPEIEVLGADVVERRHREQPDSRDLPDRQPQRRVEHHCDGGLGGDGSTSEGTVSGNNGLFQVSAAHQFATAGVRAIGVFLRWAGEALPSALGGDQLFYIAAPPTRWLPVEAIAEAQKIANQSVPIERTSDISGPDATKWYAKDLIYHLKRRLETKSNNNVTDLKQFVNQAANHMSHKWINFGAPAKGKGANTVVLGDLVTAKKQLGIIAFGFVPTVLC
jgi:hypothetical protein